MIKPMAFDETPQPVATALVRFADLFVVLISGMAARIVRFGTLDVPMQYDLALLGIVLLIVANVFHFFRLYEFAALANRFFQARRLLAAWCVVGLVVLAMGFLTKTSADYSRILAVAWFIIGFVALAIERWCVRILIARRYRSGKAIQRLAVIGAGPEEQRLIEHIKHIGDPGARIVGVFSDRTSRVSKRVKGEPVAGGVEDLLSMARTTRIDQVLIALPWAAEKRIFQLMRKLNTIPTRVRLCPEGIAYRLAGRHYTKVAGLDMLRMGEPPLTQWQKGQKTIADYALASLMLIFISPLMLAIAAAIKIDSRGPVIFRQKRYGYNNRVIEVYKFRTMVYRGSESEYVPQAKRNDPRITKIGQFLRRTSLDELPQFVNVLKGEMSIVGPRPHAVPHNREFAKMIETYMGRHNMKPGITGWAQVNGYRGEIRSKEDIVNRVEHDLYYVANWSLGSDIKIMLMTVLRGIVHQNAY